MLNLDDGGNFSGMSRTGRISDVEMARGQFNRSSISFGRSSLSSTMPLKFDEEDIPAFDDQVI